MLEGESMHEGVAFALRSIMCVKGYHMCEGSGSMCLKGYVHEGVSCE